MTPGRSQKHGYTMVLILLFLVLFLGLWGLAARQIGSMMRIEQARIARIRNDATQWPANIVMAHAMAALEVAYPPSLNYVCGALGPDGSVYAVTFANDPDNPAQWVVSVSPSTDNSLPVLDPSAWPTVPSS